MKKGKKSRKVEAEPQKRMLSPVPNEYFFDRGAFSPGNSEDDGDIYPDPPPRREKIRVRRRRNYRYGEYAE